MATLSEYIQTSGKTQSAFAAELGVSRSYMSHLVKRTRTPSLQQALLIVDLSGGAVDIQSLVSASDSAA